MCPRGCDCPQRCRSGTTTPRPVLATVRAGSSPSIEADVEALAPPGDERQVHCASRTGSKHQPEAAGDRGSASSGQSHVRENLEIARHRDPEVAASSLGRARSTEAKPTVSRRTVRSTLPLSSVWHGPNTMDDPTCCSHRRRGTGFPLICVMRADSVVSSMGEAAVQGRAAPGAAPAGQPGAAISWRSIRPRTNGGVVDYTERLRCLAINDARFVHDVGGGDAGRSLDPKSLAVARSEVVGPGAPRWVGRGGRGRPVLRRAGGAAVSAGASAPEIVDVLVGFIPIVGLACVVAAAPKRLPPRRGNVR
jgi:4-carboxymuconolactone decarboxylase